MEHAATFASIKVDNSANLKNFMDNIKIRINEVTKTDMNFDIQGIDAPIANALRRIIIAEVLYK
jgi:DNA-directed RNA polymerases I and III subunit RPAC1